MYRLVPTRSYYDHIAQDTVAMIVNDMVTLGALPLAVAMHLGRRLVRVVQRRAPRRRSRGRLANGLPAGALRVGRRGDADVERALSNAPPSCWPVRPIGIVQPKGRLIRANIQHGDAIVVFESSGMHANGLTLARAIAERAPNGYLTPLRDGGPYGEALLDPTHIYVGQSKIA